MKVAFIISGLTTGGAEIMLYRLLAHNPSLRQGPVIALAGEGEVAVKLRALGVRVECLDMRPSLPSPFAMQRMHRVLQEEQPDVISTWLPLADLFGGLMGWWMGIPVTWGIHASDISSPRHPWRSRMAARICAKLSSHIPARVACCSMRAKQDCIAFGYTPEHFEIIPNGFDIADFAPDATARDVVRKELGLPSETLLVGQIARFSPQKNHLGFIEAARLLKQRLPNVHFVLVGGGVNSQNKPLVDAIQAADLVSAVSLLGLRTDIPRLTSALDVLVSPSGFGEAFPLVLGEAMACGIPCVTTDVGDSAYIVGDTGVVVPPNDMEALAAGCEQILKLPLSERQALGQRARQRIEQNFSIDIVSRQYQGMFEQVQIIPPRAGYAG